MTGQPEPTSIAEASADLVASGAPSFADDEDLMSIEEYAIDLVCSGAEDCATDDMNEEDEIADEDHHAAMDLALDMARTIRKNPEPFLAWYNSIREAS